MRTKSDFFIELKLFHLIFGLFLGSIPLTSHADLPRFSNNPIQDLTQTAVFGMSHGQADRFLKKIETFKKENNENPHALKEGFHFSYLQWKTALIKRLRVRYDSTGAFIRIPGT